MALSFVREHNFLLIFQSNMHSIKLSESTPIVCEHTRCINLNKNDKQYNKNNIIWIECLLIILKKKWQRYK